MTVWYQAQHLDIGFYDTYYPREALPGQRPQPHARLAWRARMTAIDETCTAVSEERPDSPDRCGRGDRGARQSRRWLSSEIPLDKLMNTPYGEVP